MLKCPSMAGVLRFTVRAEVVICGIISIAILAVICNNLNKFGRKKDIFIRDEQNAGLLERHCKGKGKSRQSCWKTHGKQPTRGKDKRYSMIAGHAIRLAVLTER